MAFCGVLLPKYKNQRNVDTFEFAIDLGTSNTHIEYCKEGKILKFLILIKR